MSAATHKAYEIDDIRSGVMMDLREEVVTGLSKPPGQRTIPTVVLYDEEGLLLYDAITTEAKEYYLFGAEEDILRRKAVDVVRAMHGGHDDEACDVLELGAGALRKTSHLLKALASESHSQVTYYALDLEPRELDRTLGELTNPESELAQQLRGHVQVRGLCGTYEDGIKMVRKGGLDVAQRKSVAWESAGRQGRPLAGDVPALRRRGSSPSPMSRESADSSSSDHGSSHSHRSGYSTPPTPDSAGAHLDDAQAIDKHRPLHIAFLGSSIGNFPRDAAADFLQSLPLRPGSGDTLLLGLDGRNDPKMVELAYHDPAGHTERFIMNGLKAAGRLLGSDSLIEARKWAYESRFNDQLGRHEAYYKCLEDHMIRLDGGQTAEFVEGELVHIENAYKYSDKDAYDLFNAAQLVPVRRWKDSEGRYSLWLLERPAVFFPLAKQVSPSQEITQKALTLAEASVAPFAVPTLDDWSALWNAWDAITLGMISPQMMHERPIDLRHICLFYLGHIPAFLDIHLSRLLNEPHTKPEYFKDIFERGIDPHVDDPTQCHPHSEVPTEASDWPSLDEILAFRDRVRTRVKALYADLDSGAKQLTRKTARVLAMTLEHEGFHSETLLYMLLQRAGPPEPGTLPPPNTRTPDWDGLREEWDTLPQATETIELGPEDVVLGHDDPEQDDDDTALLDGSSWEFGWDNEHPRRTVSLGKAIRVGSRCITNGEYETYWLAERAAGRAVETPKSWVISDADEVQVRTLYGPVPLHIAHDWPVLASYDALDQYATAKGGRLPTEAELRLFMDRYFESSGANFGLKNWHLTPATTGAPGTDGRGHNGGAFEWTSTVMMNHPGYEASRLYPGYSSDFFDSKHQVVLGGSYATIPRIAQRRTVRNFYQHNYPYAWVAARVVFDA